MKKSLIRSTIFLVTLSILSKIFGLLRDVLLASKFGSSTITDTFFLGNTSIILFSAILTQAITTTIVPMLSKIHNEQGPDRKMVFTSKLLIVFGLTSLGFSVTVFFTSDILSSLIAPGFSVDALVTLSNYIKIGSPVIFIYTIASILSGYLQSENSFIDIGLSDLILNFLNVLFLLIISTLAGLNLLMISLTISGLIRIALQVFLLRKIGFRYKLQGNIFEKYIFKLLKLSIPVILSVSIGDLNKLIDKMMASRLESGSISALSYAAKVNNIFLSVFIISLMTVFFPQLSRLGAKTDKKLFTSQIDQLMKLILVIVLPIVFTLFLSSDVFINILFRRGEFTYDDVIITSNALKFYSFSLIGLSIRLLLIKVFYSLQDTYTPLVFGILSSLLNIGLNILLIEKLGYIGLALSTSIATILLAIALLFMLWKKGIHLSLKVLILDFLKICILSFSMSLIIEFIFTVNSNFFFNVNVYSLIVVGVIYGIFGAAYLLTLFVFDIGDIKRNSTDLIGRIKNEKQNKKNI